MIDNFNNNENNLNNSVPEEENKESKVDNAPPAPPENPTPQTNDAPTMNNGTQRPPYNPPSYNNGGQMGYNAPHVPYGNGYSNSAGQYNQYPNFQNPMKPEAPKKQSKGKKTGFIVAMSVIAVLVAAAIIVVTVFSVKKIQNDATKKDDTQLNIVENQGESTNQTDSNGGLSPKAVYEKVHKSSVGLLVYSGSHQRAVGEGSGVVMGQSGDKKGTYIITCAHVVQTQSPRVVVQTHDGTQYEGEVVGIDSKTDVGLVYVDSTEFVPAEFADASALSVGDKVYAIGNPGGMQFFGSFTDGMISAIGRPVNSPVGYEVPCIQHTAAINPGNSGGALVNDKGQVIGINSSKIASTEYEGMGFSVPTSTVKEIVDQIIKNGRVINRAALGIKFAPVMSNQAYTIVAQANNLPSGSIIVSTIMNGSDVANKGIKDGDIIIAANGKDLETYDDLLNIVENGKVGDKVKLTVCRVDTDYKISKFDAEVQLVSDSDITEPEPEQPQTFPFPFGR